MRLQGESTHTIRHHPRQPGEIQVLDQRNLPFEVIWANLNSAETAARAIREMWVRGAPLIGVTAAYGVWLASRECQQVDNPAAYFEERLTILRNSRPTAVNLFWAIKRVTDVLKGKSLDQWPELAWKEAEAIRLEEIATCRAIGEKGVELIREISRKKNGAPVNILTHCNAGWLACIDWGTATAPIYKAHQEGLAVHVWVDETRPRNQGARLTAFELSEEGVPHTVIADNTGGLLMQKGKVDLCLVGSDRCTRTGDVANKIGTYLKALAAQDNGVPFYVALPGSTFDWELTDGLLEIPIEERSAEEVTHIRGWDERSHQMTTVRLCPEKSPGLNYGFDVTPSRLVTGLITERGICSASGAGIQALFPEKYPLEI